MSKRIVLTPDDLYEADKRATPEERDLLHASLGPIGLSAQVFRILDLLGRRDEIPAGAHLRGVWRQDSTLGAVHIEFDEGPDDENG